MVVTFKSDLYTRQSVHGICGPSIECFFIATNFLIDLFFFLIWFHISTNNRQKTLKYIYI